MVNSLLSLILVATQVLSWNAAPLFLCLESDGTACFDFGPDTCGCCHDVASTPGATESLACHEHAGCNHAEHAQPAGSTTDSQASGSPCGCTHVQISDPQTAALGRATIKAVDLDFQPMLAIVACPGLSAIESATADTAGIDHLPVAASPLALRAGIVLRI
jgi:hypothetical protein